MTKLLTTVAIVCGGTAALLAQAGGTAARSQAPVAPKPAAKAAAPVPSEDAKTYRAFVNQYCVGCHNTKNEQPTSHPVDLEKASLDDVVHDADTWELVLRKLSVRAMPQQNMPHPPEAEYAAFKT